MKRCPSCGFTKPPSDFGPDKRRKDGRRVYCRDCRNKKARDTYFGNASMRRHGYWLTASDYYSLLTEQLSGCSVCRYNPYQDDEPGRTTWRLNVDHDHSTGEVRGLLCRNCNRALGLLQDNPEIVSALLDYLVRSE